MAAWSPSAQWTKNEHLSDISTPGDFDIFYQQLGGNEIKIYKLLF
jgi:hypothetical protein